MNAALRSVAELAPALAMVGVFALAIGGAALIRRGEDRRKGVLMLAAAAVLFGNVLIWTV